MRSEFFIIFVATVAGAAGVSAAPAKPQAVEISFALAADGQPVDCGHDIHGLGANHVNAKLREASFYVSDAALIDKNGKATPIELTRNDWQYANVALIDFDDKTGNCRGTKGANATLTGQVPAGRYQGLSFVIGVPTLGKGDDGKEVSLNHSNFATAPAPLDIQSMSWSWQAGRKFVKLEVAPEGGIVRPPMPPRPPRAAAAGSASPPPRADAPEKADQTPEPIQSNADGTITVATWMLHLGSTGCKGDPITGEIVACATPNRVPVTLARFDPVKQRVVLDLQSLLAPFDLNRDKGGATGCMSGPTDPECAAVFDAFGLGAKESAQPGEGAKSGNVAAKLFKVESK
ncbi:metallo-mystery pair system four-Cys motif protein [Methylocystis parvus]|uniref:Metallo-mystery pair system four-Cys motif protein n=2 Tax=Methylocystis parvus TaxID=134 RepID=A0A6B8MD47_9HYPH|nr:metallo-mystery pair system four-Cys motif protein [Methylocystis parvus]